MTTPKSIAPKDIHIDDPQSFHCTIWRYQAGHHQMLVRVCRIEESGDELAFYVCFGGVIYFEGPLQWSGADFISGSEEECIGILRRMGVKHAEEAVRSDYFRLFRVKLPQLEVRIIATAAMTLEESEIARLSPASPCMVSAEGACAAYYKYGGRLA